MFDVILVLCSHIKENVISKPRQVSFIVGLLYNYGGLNKAWLTIMISSSIEYCSMDQIYILSMVLASLSTGMWHIIAIVRHHSYIPSQSESFSVISDILGMWIWGRNHFNGSLPSKNCANLLSLIDNPCSLDIFRRDDSQVFPFVSIFTATLWQIWCIRWTRSC